MISRVLALFAVLIAIAGAAPAAAQSAGLDAPPAPNNYADKTTWLCWPGMDGSACDTDLTTTVIQSSGAMTIEPFKADPRANIDCFYVYPTVSTDPGVLATMAAEPAETRVVAQQFARFGASCRLFAPLYRQFTVTALAAAMAGHPLSNGARPITPYLDVLNAWNYYLAHENGGRGVVLIGHSQGSIILTELIKREIDGKTVQARLVSAILMGTNLVVPKGADVGGDFKSIPLCHSATQLGCVIAYGSFRDTSPPPANSRFGRPRSPETGMVSACVNPANLTGGEGGLHSYFAAGSEMIGPSGQAPVSWVKGKTVSTPFVSLPGLLSARCVSTPDFNYLAIHVNADPGSPRTSNINGDLIVGGGVVLKDWGLHLIDANLAMGNLVGIVAAEGATYAAHSH